MTQASPPLSGGIVPTKAEIQRDRLMALVDDLPADERRAALDALDTIAAGRISKAQAYALITSIVEARARTEQRRKSDRRTDRRRRTIVGARVPRGYADLCRQAARDRGVSLNKWCLMAIAEALAHHYAADDVGTDPNPWYGFR